MTPSPVSPPSPAPASWSAHVKPVHPRVGAVPICGDLRTTGSCRRAISQTQNCTPTTFWDRWGAALFLPGTSLSLRRPLGERCVSPCWEGGVSGPRSHAPGRAGRVLGLSRRGRWRPQPPPTVACERQPGFPVRADWSAAVAPAPSVPLGGPFLPSGREQTRTCQRFWAARSFSPKPGSVRHRPHRGLRPPLRPHVQRPERPLRLQDGSGGCHPGS